VAGDQADVIGSHAGRRRHRLCAASSARAQPQQGAATIAMIVFSKPPIVLTYRSTAGAIGAIFDSRKTT
jgi:hypothetical protein